MDEKELYDELLKRLRVQKLKALPNVSRYRNEPYTRSPLLSFSLERVRHQQIQTFLKQLAVSDKVAISKKIKPGKKEYPIHRPVDYYLRILREQAETVHPPGIMMTWKLSICQLLPPVLRKKYSLIVDQLLQEVSLEYEKTLRDLGIRLMLKPLPGEVWPSRPDRPLQHHGKTERYSVFLRNRAYLNKRLFLTHPIIRGILDKACLIVPDLLNDYSKYRALGLIEYDRLKSLLFGDLKKGESLITNTWYPKIVAMLSEKRALTGVPSQLWPSFLDCASHVLACLVRTTLTALVSHVLACLVRNNTHSSGVSCAGLSGKSNTHSSVVSCAGLSGKNTHSSGVTESMRKTIDHLLEVTTDHYKVPYLKIDLYYEDTGIEMSPSKNEIYSLYHNITNSVRLCLPAFFVGKIASLAQSLPPLETWVDVKTNKKVLKIKLSDHYLNHAHAVLETNLDQLLAPIFDYTRQMEDTFDALYDESLIAEIKDFIRAEPTFDQCCEKIRFFQEYLGKISSLVMNQYFNAGRVCQNDVIKNLREFAQSFIDDILKYLVTRHRAENERICGVFSEVMRRAFKVPQSTEELMAMGEYMLHANTKLMEELKAANIQQLHFLARLMDLVTLDPEHVRLNAKTVHWLQMIQPIFKQNATRFEQFKFEFESNLAQKTEQLNKQLDDLGPRLVILNLMDEANNVDDYVQHIMKLLRKMNVFDQQVTWINKEEALFKFPLSTYPELDELKNIIFPFSRLVFQIHKWKRKYRVWMDGAFDELVMKVVEDKTEEFFREITKMQKVYRTKIRQQAVENNPRRFKGNVDDADFVNLPAPIKLCVKTLQHIKEFRQHVPLVGILCNPALTQRHWDEMSSVVGYDLTPDAGSTLRKMVDLGLGPYLDQFEIVSIGANKEKQLQENLMKMLSEWADIKFTVNTYKETGIPILSALEDIQAVLDDHLIKTLTMRGSAFVKPFEAEIIDWYDKLVRMNKTIDEWGKVQSQWLYLLPIFSSKDIIAQMPQEGALFQVSIPLLQEINTGSNEVDGIYKRIMNAVSKEPRVLQTAGTVGILEFLLECTGKLETITDGVNNYLEKKRLFFPRFFFLSNDEILEILSETKDPLRVQPHLKKCFEGIAKLGFDDKLDIYSMLSAQGEEVKLIRKVSTEEARGSVEKWLLQVEEQMKVSVRDVIQKSHMDYSQSPRPDWITHWAGQVVLCVAMVFWTAEVHDILDRDNSVLNLISYHKKLQVQLNDTVALVRGKLSKQTRTTLGALVVLDVHAKDVTEELYKHETCSPVDFLWLAQLRYYWEFNIMVRIINATVNYAYEYLGNTDRLVITPLTDRCYRTLIGAYHLHLNGAPEGPAGTGKTETTKDLAKALAVQCVVFNCSDGLDYIAMGKFFKGLASAGAWACFDEFNRIELEVLSVVAQQILCIVQAVQAKMTTFIFEGTELVLNPACYVCITMNPGYAGRSELPDNLKVLFRTVAMMVPDYALIGEISLYSYGFVDARNLSVKIVTTYRLCSEQLSSQSHYDYGMRAVKTVLSAAGNLKLKYPDEKEDMLLLRSIIDVNLPKFLSHDIPLFEGIISDLFPGVVLPTISYDTFLVAMKQTCAELNLQLVPTFQLNVIQTYEMMVVRHGFMLVGGPYAGKTSALKVLAGALTLLEEQGEDENKVMFQIINPKSVTMGQLYGQFDPVSYEWTDGVVATLFRSYAQMDTPDRKWVVFDGPVDAVWIENMNTVLDDNKKLCLTSGEIIALTSSMSMIFEVMDLTQASPATVSRCGMIYFEPLTLGWKPLMLSWLSRLDPVWREGHEQLIEDMFDWIIPPCLQFVRRHGVQLVTAGEANLVKSTMLLIQMLISEAMKESEDTRYIRSWLQGAFVYSGVWGVAGILDTESREAFDEFYKDIWRGNNPDCPVPESLEKVDISIPGEGLLHDYVYIFKMKGNWKYWPELLKTTKTKETINIQQTMIPTVDTLKYQYILDLHIRYGHPMLLVGDTGTGKSFYVQNIMMSGLSMEDYVPAFITFTVQTSANQTQDLVLSKLHKRRKGQYGPPHNKKAVIFVDDLNMPAKEIYGAQPAIELLRQYFDHGYWYDLKDTSMIYLFDMMLLAAMGLPGGSRQEVYERFLCHFNIYSINPFTDESMSRIFTSVLLMGLKRNGFATDVMVSVMSIVQATLDMYHSATNDLRPTPSKSHYIFNLRDFSRVVQGCSLVKRDSVDNKKVFIKLWVHEVLRVFYDRLIDSSDRHWLYEKLRGCVQDHFKDNFDSSLDTLPMENGKVTEESLQSLMFGTYLDVDAADDDKKYEEVMTMESFYNIATEALADYNATTKAKMDIVLFRYALEHLSRICRILSTPGGCGLLVGVGGSGRQSLTRLATAISGYHLFQPEITKNYGGDTHDKHSSENELHCSRLFSNGLELSLLHFSITLEWSTIPRPLAVAAQTWVGLGEHEWRDDLKRVLKLSGGEGKNATFLLTETQIKEEVFLQDVDSLLNSGEVPNLFPIDEQQEILEIVRLAAQGGNRNLDITALEVLSFFVSRCKQKLHIILCFSPIGASFRKRLRLFPSLVNCCTIDWFQPYKTMKLNEREFVLEQSSGRVRSTLTLPCGVFQVWPEDALEKVARKYMMDINVPEEVKSAAVVACKYFHVTSREVSDKFYAATGRKTYITSAAYLGLIRSFTELTNLKQEELMLAKQRYVGGLDRLLSASEDVMKLQKDLSDLKPELEKAAGETLEMMTRIERETVEVERASGLVREDEKVANVQAAAAQALKKECEADLAQAIPILEDAIAALNTLKPTDITLVKSMKNPPDAIKLVMAAVCVMKDVKPDRILDAASGRRVMDYWGPSKRILGDMYFLQSLKDFDKDNIAPAIMKKIRSEFLPNKDFKPHVVAKASSAAEGLCKWVIAMDMYDAVAKEVAPKKAKLELAEQEYNATMALLNEKRAQVAHLEAQLMELKNQLAEANKRKKDLEEEVDLIANKLTRAEKLIGGLGGEKTRWSDAAEVLQRNYNSLAGDILISCGIISYLAPFTAAYRNDCIEDWRDYVVRLTIPCSNVYNFSKVLGSEIKIQSWNITGLPRDQFSTDNAIIVDMSKRWSLLVDPQGQANKWIKSMEKLRNLKVIKFSDSDYMKVIEQSVEAGTPVLLENVGEELEPPLEPLLAKQIYKQGQYMVTAGQIALQMGCKNNDGCWGTGNTFYINLGDNTVEYKPEFRFYMTSKMRNPHFLPEVFNSVTIVNFALTIEGLEDQLLGICGGQGEVSSSCAGCYIPLVLENILFEPDLEDKRQELIVQSAANEKMLKQVEDSILITLSGTEGNILENESAIEVLDSSKVRMKVLDSSRVRMEVLDSSRVRIEVLDSSKVCMKGLDSSKVRMEVLDSFRVRIEVLDSSRVRMEVLDSSKVRIEVLDFSKVRMNMMDSSKVRMEVLDSSRVRMEVLDSSKVRMNMMDSSKVRMEVLESSRVRMEVLDSSKVRMNMMDSSNVRREVLDSSRVCMEVLDSSKVRMNMMDSSKILSLGIVQRQEAAKDTKLKIESFRLSYRPIARHSAVLYYCITDLPNVDPMYQYSLVWFINLYTMSIESSTLWCGSSICTPCPSSLGTLPGLEPMYQYSLVWFINLYTMSIEFSKKSKFLEKRLQYLHETFTYNLYSNVCRSLFEKDKLLFSFILCTNIMLLKTSAIVKNTWVLSQPVVPDTTIVWSSVCLTVCNSRCRATNVLTKEEFHFFLTGGVALENPLKNRASSWLGDKSWDELCRVIHLPAFYGFVESFTSSLSEWKEFYDLADPHLGKLPEPWEQSLTPFQHLIIIRIFRPDKIIATVTLFIEKEMGEKFVMPPPFDISCSYEDSNCLSPLIFILSPGADPMAALSRFADKMGYGGKFESISLGQGQGPIARMLIETAQQDGLWVCLQNCHLAVSWMPELERIWESWDTRNTNLHFRLWLTSYPSDKFPVSLLQNGVKMTNEPPTGLQQNLLRSYQSDPVKDPTFYEGCPRKDRVFTKLLYGICFFHAVVQERKKFGSIGWNIPYGFNESDFHISIKQLQMFINESADVPYEAILYLTGECNYGGRVTDDWDRRTLTTILEDFVNEQVVTSPSYLFCRVSEVYGLPRKTEYQVYIQHIEVLTQPCI
ncbi:unnamed protein product, partial [Timema podura]|nr:unnamed protein product [Timema podura]